MIGPVRRVQDWVYTRGHQIDDEGYELVEYWLDEMGHEYTSVKHVLLCAVARALEVER